MTLEQPRRKQRTQAKDCHLRLASHCGPSQCGAFAAWALAWLMSSALVAAQPAGPLTSASAPPRATVGDPALDRALEAMGSGRYAAAVGLLEPQAAAGNEIAQLILGSLLELGRGTAVDKPRAAALYEQARVSQPAAAFRLALLLERGDGVPRDPARASVLLNDAAERDDVNANFLLGQRAQFGLGGTGRSLTLALRHYRRAANLGHADAMVSLAGMLRRGPAEGNGAASAYELVSKAAKTGSVRAQVELGDYHYEGVGTERNGAEAVKWWRRAAERNDPSAQERMGVAYGRGIGVEPNEATAREWYEKAARQGRPNAQHNIANMYRDGRAVTKDMRRAVSLWESAAVQGHVPSQLELAQHMLRGADGVERDVVQAYRWLTALQLGGVRVPMQPSVGQGDFVDYLITEAHRVMTPDQIERGKALAARDAALRAGADRGAGP